MRQSHCFVLCLLVYLITSNQLQAQYFSLLPDINKDGQAQNYNIIIEDDRFYIIGDLQHFITKDVIPVISEFDYSGNLLKVDTMKDINFQYNFQLNYDNPHIKISDSIYIFVFSKELENFSYLVPYFIKYNIYSKNVLESKVQILGTNEFITAISLHSTKNHFTSISYSYSQPHINKLFIYNLDFTLVDSLLIIDSIGRIFLPQFINNLGDSLVIIGQTAIRNNVEKSLQIYSMIINLNNHNIIKNRITVARSLGLSNFNTDVFSINNKNETVIASTHYKTGIDRPNDYNFFINPIKLSNNLDSIIWELPLFKNNFTSIPRRDYNSMTYIQSEDNYIVAGDEIAKNGACILFKFSGVGDSIWFKRIVPGFLHDTSVSFVPTHNIKVSPKNGVLITGSVHNNVTRKIIPYIMHLDYDGCLVPGCNTITKTERDANNVRLLTNPVANILVLKSEIDVDNIVMEIIDIAGNITVKKSMSLFANSEYVWFASDLHVGVYVLKLYTKSGRVLYSEKFIKS